MQSINKYISKLTKILQMNYFKQLVEKDNGISSKSFFLVVVTVVGCILLLVPAIVLIVEVCCNHTIQTDLNGLAAYIGAVAGVFASAGITKAWSEKYECNKCKEQNSRDKIKRDDS